MFVLAFTTVALLPGTVSAQQELAPATPLPGPTVRKLTLEEARQLALANNKALNLARINVQEKQLGTAAAKTDYYPKILGSVTYFHFNDDLGTLVTIPRGPRGLVGGNTIAATVLNQDSALSTVFVAQPITKLIAVNAGVQLARAEQNIAQAQLDKGAREVLSGVAQLYEGLLGSQRIQKALEFQINMVEQVLTAKPLPELKVALVEAKQGLSQVRAQIQQLTAQLNDLLNLPACTVLELVDPLPPPLPVQCADDAARMATQNNPEVLEAEQSIAKAQAALKVAKMEYLPDVNVIGGYANQTVASYIQPNIGYVGVTANYTFWGWGKRHKVCHQRQTLVELAHQNLAVTVDKVQLEARKTYVEYAQAEEALKLAKEMVDARKEVEKAAAGAAALQARNDAAKAQLDEMKAEITYRIAHAKLATTIGAP
jgi:outer membrane protein TolC